MKLNDCYHNVIIKHRLSNLNNDGLQHDFDWSLINILRKEENLNKMLFTEMFFIKKNEKLVLIKYLIFQIYLNILYITIFSNDYFNNYIGQIQYSI